MQSLSDLSLVWSVCFSSTLCLWINITFEETSGCLQCLPALTHRYRRSDQYRKDLQWLQLRTRCGDCGRTVWIWRDMWRNSLSSLTGWAGMTSSLGACFHLRLNDKTIRGELHSGSYPLIELINLVLFLNGSDWEVEAIPESCHPAPAGTHSASPAHPMPRTSAYFSNGSPAYLTWKTLLRLRCSHPAHLRLSWPRPAYLRLRWPCPAHLRLR